MLENRDSKFDLFALGLLAFTVFVGLSLLSYSPADPIGETFAPLDRIYQADILIYPQNDHIANACGRAGALAADILLRVFGWGAYYAVFCLAALDAWLLMRRPIDGAVVRMLGWLASFTAAVTFVSMFAPSPGMGPVIGPGGILGAMGRSFLESHFATAGSLILLTTLMMGGLLLCTDYVLLHFAAIAGVAVLNLLPRGRFNLLGRLGQLGSLVRGRRRLTDEEDEYEYEDDEYEYEEEDEEEEEAPSVLPIKVRGKRVSDLGSPRAAMAGKAFADEESEANGTDSEEYEEDEASEAEDEYEDEDEQEEESTDEGVDREAVAASAKSRPAPTFAANGAKSRKGQGADGAERELVIAQLDEADREHDPQDYELPPIDLLLPSEGYSIDDVKREVQRKAALLEKTFQDFNLDVRVVDIETGPVIAQYEVELTRGLRLSKIVSLEDDLAIALRVPNVRIARIPGKNTVGIEVPNDTRQMVRLREVIEETNSRVKRMSIPVFLGKDVSGNPLVTDLASLPHLLIAGRTGTGKSVCLNAIISSILMTRTPDDVRMLMIDPKMVELSGYARLPHLMHPVVTDMRKAEAILAWACDKMDERYQLLARAGVRHLNSYNQLGEEELMERLDPESDEERNSIPRHLPFIVIVADEMADLMITCGKEVEAHIIRLAAKSRAVGIHLILATQKPTVDVITGLIKSNLPARIAFQVASKTDSRVVLDEGGADKLLGHGDMLFLWPGTSKLLRGQGTYLSDDEIDRIVDYCGSKGEQNFVRELVQLKIEDGEEKDLAQLKKRDELYEEAVDVVVREGRGSVSLLQRNLQIGYGRAARLIDFMAEDGIVGTYNGSQAREVLMTLTDWEVMKGAGGVGGTTGDIVEKQTAVIVAPEKTIMRGLAEERAIEDEELDDEDSYEDEEDEYEEEVAEDEYEEEAYEEEAYDEEEVTEEGEDEEDEDAEYEDESVDEDEYEEVEAEYEGDDFEPQDYEDEDAELTSEEDDSDVIEDVEAEVDEYEEQSEAFEYDADEYEPADVKTSKPSKRLSKRGDPGSKRHAPHDKSRSRSGKKKIVVHRPH